MSAGEVEMLVVLEGNPVYNAPADLDFAGALDKVSHKVRFGLHEDETSAACDWHLPLTHFLESWGDARAWDGTHMAVQPLIQPLYDGHMAIELLSLLVDEEPRGG